MGLLLVVALAAFLGAPYGKGMAQVRPWPEVEPFTVIYRFPSARKAHIRKIIEGRNGKPLYVLECYAHQVAPAADVFAYSGDFECVLHTFNPLAKGYSTLLTELPHANADWESRGRFLAAQLAGRCGRYPNLGASRTFRLRGFEVRLKLTNIVFDSKRESLWRDAAALKSFDLQVKVEPDPSARGPIAASPPLPPLDTIPDPCRQAFGSLYLQRFRVGGHDH